MESSWGDSLRGRVSLEIHRRFLARFIRPQSRVLEIGAGPGRFTLQLAALGASVTVTDISSVQLDLNRLHVSDTPAEQAVESRQLLDDATRRVFQTTPSMPWWRLVEPLSCAFDHTDEALVGLFRVTKPVALVLASVMSLLGSWRYFLRGVIQDTQSSERQQTSWSSQPVILNTSLASTSAKCSDQVTSRCWCGDAADRWSRRARLGVAGR